MKSPLKSYSRFSWYGKVAIILLFIVISLALFAPIFAPFEPELQNLNAILAPANAIHWLGTDYLGRDIFSRILYGARLSLGCTFIILAMIIALGVGVGGLCGFIGGRLDALCMRVCDIFISIPTIALSLFLVGVLGAGLENVMIAIVATHWAWYARIVRSIVFSMRNKEYVLLSISFGASAMQRLRRHILTPIISQCAVLASMDIGHIMLHIAGLSFLGLGVQPPVAEWGIMISEAKDYMWDNPMLIVYPGLALFVCVALCNMIGESLRDYFDISHKMRDSIADVALAQKTDSKKLDSISLPDSQNGTLAIQNLHIDNGDKPLLRLDSICIKSGECVALLGPSGSGKTLSAMALQGFIADNLSLKSAKVLYNQIPIYPPAYRGRLFACVVQSPRTCFNPLFSIASHFRESAAAMHIDYIESFARECLSKAGLDEGKVLSMYPFELSGGMLQRVMIALALFSKAPFIIADEISSDLDARLAHEILNTLMTLQKSDNLGILLITHDLELVAHFAQYVYVIEKGRVIESAQIKANTLVSNDKHLPKTQIMRLLKHIVARGINA